MILLLFTSICSLFPPQTPPITHFLAILMTKCILSSIREWQSAGNCRPWGCGTPTNELKMSCWCNILHKCKTYIHTNLQYVMTTNQKAIQRVFDLVEQGKKLVEKGMEELEVRKELDRYHDLRYVVSYTTKNDDINKVMTRLFN